MRLTFRPVAGMGVVVQMRFIHHLEALWGESVGELALDRVDCPHSVRLQHDPEKCEAVFGQDHAQKRFKAKYRVNPVPALEWIARKSA
jgi:hypothetical protein